MNIQYTHTYMLSVNTQSAAIFFPRIVQKPYKTKWPNISTIDIIIIILYLANINFISFVFVCFTGLCSLLSRTFEMRMRSLGPAKFIYMYILWYGYLLFPMIESVDVMMTIHRHCRRRRASWSTSIDDY